MRHFAVALLSLLAALALCACPEAKQPSPNATAVLGSSQTRGSLPAGAKSVTLDTADGWRIAGWYWAPASPKGKAPGVILLHQFGRDKASWGAIPAQLVKQGYAVVAIDLRGHGESVGPGGQRVAPKELTDPDYTAMLRDVRAADQYLGAQPGVDRERIGIIGASIGADLAIIYLSASRHVRTAVCLSPGLNYHGLKPLEFMQAVDKRPLYLIAGQGDTDSAKAADELSKAGTVDGPKSLRLLDGSAHGTDLFAASDGLDKTICSGWMLNYLPPKR
jgi:dienelactone hydrolase